MAQPLCCYFCRAYFGDYTDAATIQLRLYCKHCKGHCVFEVHDGALVTIRFEPKADKPALPSPNCPE